MSKSGNSFTSSVIYKYIETMAGQAVSFVIGVLLARLLYPEDYGTLALITMFTAIAQVIVQKGINTALIQNKDVTNDDYSTVFWTTFSMSAVIYTLLFFAAPFIEQFYEVEGLVVPFRTMSLIIFIGAFNSIQVAKLQREMKFRQLMLRSLFSTALSGGLGIFLAYQGFGVWALIWQQLANYLINCIFMLVAARWFPRPVYNVKRIKILYSFGWKILATSLFETLYEDLVGLIIGKKYSSTNLGLYNKGKNFPHLVMWSVASSVGSVMLPIMSRMQDSLKAVCNFTRKTIRHSVFLIFPMMAGMAVVAKPMIRLLLTDKWIACVPYVIAFCIVYLMVPLGQAYRQSYIAVGRSDIPLKLLAPKWIVNLTALLISVFCFEDPIAIAIGMAAIQPVLFGIYLITNKKIIGYRLRDQIADLLPCVSCTAVMVGVIYPLSYLPLSDIVCLVLQIILGMAVYFVSSYLFNRDVLLSYLRRVTGVFKRKGKH